jgi:deoxyribonuclease V
VTWTGRRRAPLHRWNLTPAEAIALQRRLAPRIRVEPLRRPIRTVAGLDQAVFRDRNLCRAGAVLLDVETLDPIARSRVDRPIDFPYVPGLLSFREAPGLIEALGRLPALPDLLLLDGQGLAHPRRFGLACHLGLWSDLPAVGIAKSLLVGRHAPPGPNRGDRAPLIHDGEIVGAAVRTRAGVKPVYVSVGHRIELEAACDLALRLSPRFRLAEPIRLAHRWVNE